MKNSKGFVNVVLVVVIVALVGVAVYFGLQTKGDNGETFNQASYQTSEKDGENVKTYANSKYNFSFSYPSKYIITERDVTEETANFLSQSVPDTKTAYDIELKNGNERISFQVNWAYGAAPADTERTVEEVKNGIEMTKYYLNDIQGDLGKYINVTFSVGGDNYLVQAFRANSTEVDLEVILNSLKFH